MDSTTEDLYLQKIQELVFDEDKIITSVFLTTEFNIKIQDAKQLITKFVKDCREVKSNEVALTYWISGNLKNNNGMCIKLVQEAALNDTRKLYDNIITESIYSLQKYNNIDFNVISLVDKINSAEGNPILGSVISKNCIKKIITKKEPKSIPTQNSFKNQSDLNSIQKKPKIENKPESTTLKSSSLIKKPSNGNVKGGITSFFSKGSIKPNEKKIKQENGDIEKNSMKNEKENQEINGINSSEKITNEDVVESANKDKRKSVKSEKKKNGNKRQRKEDKDNEQPIKRRKRIEERYDSDSSDMFTSDGTEDIVAISDSEPEPVSVIKATPKNRVRRTVDKTYQDEEGYIVTKTEYVYETASEDEKIEEKPKINEQNNKTILRKNTSTDSENDSKKSIIGKGKKNGKVVSGKQPTLLNFFKKT